MNFSEETENIAAFKKNLTSFTTSNDEINRKRALLMGVMDDMLMNIEEYNENVVFVKRHLWSRFIGIIQEKKLQEDHIVNAFKIVVRMVKEKTLKTSTWGVNEIGALMYYRNDNITYDDKQEAEYIQSTLPSQIINDRITLDVNDFTSYRNEVAGWKDLLDGERAKLNEIKEYIGKIRSELNFAVLSRSFHDLRVKKIAEMKLSLTYMICIGAILASTICAKLAVIIMTYEEKLELRQTHGVFSAIIKQITLSTKMAMGGGAMELIQHWIPYIALILLLFYFFRITLLRYLSIRAQLLQIDLRVSIVQFIEDYVKFRNENSKKGGENLFDRFEAVLFSGITPQLERVPSTFDTFGDVVDVLKKVREALK